MVSFTFSNYCLFLELFAFFIFYHFLYFKAAFQPIMKDQYTKLKLGVEYIMYNDIDFVTTWRHKFWKCHLCFRSDILSVYYINDMFQLTEYNIHMIKQAQLWTATETTAFILLFCYNDQFSFHLKERFFDITLTIENYL